MDINSLLSPSESPAPAQNDDRETPSLHTPPAAPPHTMSPFASPSASPKRNTRSTRPTNQKRKSSGLTREIYADSKPSSPVARGSLTPLGTPVEVPEEYTAQLRQQQEEALSRLRAEEREAHVAAAQAEAQSRGLSMAHVQNAQRSPIGLQMPVGSLTQPGSAVQSPSMLSPVLGMPSARTNAATTLPHQQGQARSGSVGAVQRQNSSAGMDTLADLASMQQRQVSSPNIKHSIHYTLKHLVRTPSSGTMDQASGPGSIPRLSATPYLTDAEETELNEHYSAVISNPEDAKSRMAFIDLLHRGLQNFRAPQDTTTDQNGTARRSRRARAKAFVPLTLITVEQLGRWQPFNELLSLKQFELVLAMKPDVDTMAALIGLSPSFEAVSGSVWVKRVKLAALWWHQAAIGIDHDSLEIDFGHDVDSISHWQEMGMEDRAKSTFTWDAFIKVSYDAVASTKYSPCHLGKIVDVVWKCAQSQLATLQGEVDGTGLAERRMAVAKQCNDLFTFALREPHVEWQQTFENYTVFLALMDREEEAQTLLAQFSPPEKVEAFLRRRIPYETQFSQDIENLVEMTRSKEDQYAQWQEYLDFETGMGRYWQTGELPDQASLDELPQSQEEWEDRVNALFGRFCARLGDNPDAWTRWIIWTKDRDAAAIPRQKPRYISAGSAPLTVRSILDRAVFHCPGSGSLWSLLILHMEANGAPYQMIEEMKHSATRHNLIEDIGGPEEVIAFQVSWCGYLRRRALESGPDETDGDDILNAEIGIRGAIEHVGAIVAKSKEIPEQAYSKYADGKTPGITGDPHFRLERIYVKYLLQRSRVDDARIYWSKLQETLADYYEFWDRYYICEMALWDHWLEGARMDHHSVSEDMRFPRRATNVLRAALHSVSTLDEPEKMIASFENHVQQHESAKEIIAASGEAAKAREVLAQRRKQEMAVWQKGQEDWVAAQKQAWLAEQESNGPAGETGNKRKLSIAASDQPGSKRARLGADASETQDAHDAAEPAKRDREHGSVLLRYLPKDATEIDVKKFFRGCGNIKSVLLADANGETKTGLVEFDSLGDAQFAQMRSTRPFKGEEIEITFAGDLTLYITNYPRDFASEDLKKVFSEFGQVLSLRLPNLAKNAFRRFAYITMDSADAANAAIEKLHQKPLTDAKGKEYQMQVHISDPNVKKDREGAMYEGREIVVKNLPFKASEGDVRAFILDVMKEEVPDVDTAATNGDTIEEDQDAPPSGASDAWVKVIERVRIPQGRSKGVGFVVFRDANIARLSVSILDGRSFMGRPMTVELATSEGRKLKVTATERFNRGSSTGPSDPRNGAAPSPGSVQSAEPPESRPFARSITISNLPPTTPQAVVQAIAEKYGELRRISLRSEKGTALVEYAQEASTGKAQMALDATEVDGNTVRVALGIVADGKKTLGSGFVSRPGQGRPRRGGLGSKRGR